VPTNPLAPDIATRKDPPPGDDDDDGVASSVAAARTRHPREATMEDPRRRRARAPSASVSRATARRHDSDTDADADADADAAAVTCFAGTRDPAPREDDGGSRREDGGAGATRAASIESIAAMVVVIRLGCARGKFERRVAVRARGAAAAKVRELVWPGSRFRDLKKFYPGRGEAPSRRS
jgi:hypothetical protein